MKDHEVGAANLQDWPLPDDWLIQLGRLAATWASLESSLDTYIGKLAGFDITDPRAFILLHHSSMPQKLDNLSALCEHLAADNPWLSGYSKTVTAIRGAQTLRNRFMHNVLTRNTDTGNVEVAVGSARGKLKTSVEIVTLTDLKRASMMVHIASLSLHQLVTKKIYPPIWTTRLD